MTDPRGSHPVRSDRSRSRSTADAQASSGSAGRAPPPPRTRRGPRPRARHRAPRRGRRSASPHHLSHRHRRPSRVSVIACPSWRTGPVRPARRTQAGSSDHAWGPSSSSTASAPVVTASVATRVAFIRRTSSGGPAAARAASAWRRRRSSCVGHAPPGQADLGRSWTVDDLSEEHQGHGRLPVGDPPEPPGVPSPGMDAELQEAGVEAGGLARHDHVAGQGHVEPGPHRRTVDRGHRRERRLGHTQEPGVERPHRLGVVGGFEVGQIGPGAERRSPPR